MKKIFFLSLIAFTSCYSCGKSNFPAKFYAIQLDNHSDGTINVYVALLTEFKYPDTSIEINIPPKGNIDMNLPRKEIREIGPNRSNKFYSRDKWEEVYDKYLPGDTLSIFIFNADTIAHYDWETIRTGYKVLQRYDLSIEDLKKLDYQVPYPPTAAMAGMKIYP